MDPRAIDSQPAASTPFEIVAQGLEDGYQKPGVDGLWFLCSFFVWVEGETGEFETAGAFPPNPFGNVYQ